jgi:imidazolonepropionase
MPSTLFINIKALVFASKTPPASVCGQEMRSIPVIEQAWLLIKDEKILDFGPMSDCPAASGQVIDLNGKMVFPAWCDSHTHLVFASSREMEFVDRINGLSYEEIARRGGGILNSAKRLRQQSEDELFEAAHKRLQESISFGTGAIEIKSGYGLNVESELKMLRVIRRLKERASIPIKATFLGAHAVPPEFRNDRAGYVQLIIDEMLPAIAHEKLADYIDVFCEKGFFSLDDTIALIEAGSHYGLKAKIHTNQFNSLGCIEACVERNAISVDHLEVITEQEILSLKDSDTIPTLLPSAAFFINDPYQEARKMIDGGLGVALATDFNPGSSPSSRMQFVIALACIKCGMLPEEAIAAATLNGARAMELEQSHGTISPGKVASFIITAPMPSMAYFPYAFGHDLVEKVYISGQLFADKG